MRRALAGGAWLVFVLGLLVQAGVALADGRLVPAISRLVADAEHAPRDVLAGRAGDFEPMADGRFLLPGDAGRIYWIRLDVEFPATAGGQRHVLWLDRMPAREVRLPAAEYGYGHSV